jgi:hypothetical protein
VFAGLASYGAHRLNQLAGLTPGEPEILPRTLDDYLQLGLPMTPLAVPVAKAAGRYVGEPVIRGLRRLVPGARRAINAAEEQTAQNAADYLQTYTQEVATGTQKDVQARAGYALSEAIEAQREAARRAAHAQRVRRAEEKAATGTAKDVEDYKQALADYETATKQHLAAAERARALPEEYRPSPPPSETPGAAPAPLRPGARASSVYYQRFEDQAKGMPADLTPARTMAETFQTEFGEHLPRMLPPRMQRVITDVLNPETEGSVSQVHAFMKSIGRLTRSKDSETRGAARQLYGALAESLEISAPTHLQALLRQAKTVWKQEEGVYELQRKLRMGKSRGLLSRDPATGNIQLNVRGIVQLMDDEDVLQWFTPEVQKQFQTDIRRFVGTPALPKETPILPPPRVPTDVPPLQPRIVPPNLAKGPPPPYTPPPFEPPPPVEPKMTRRGLREALAEIGGLAALSHFGGTPGKYITGAIAAGDFANQALSRILLSPKLRRLLLRSMEPNGTIDPQMFGMLAAAADVLPLGTENVSEEAARTETTDVGIPYTTERPR